MASTLYPVVTTRTKDPVGFKKFLKVVDSGKVDAVLAMVPSRYHPNEQDDKGVSALYTAARKGDIPMMRALIKAGASLDILTDAGASPLSGAIEKCKKDKDPVLFLLTVLDKRADVRLQNKINETKRSLLERKSDVNVQALLGTSVQYGSSLTVKSSFSSKSTPMDQMRARSVISSRTARDSLSAEAAMVGSGSRLGGSRTMRSNRSLADMTDSQLTDLATEDTLLEHHLEDFYGEPANYANIKEINLSNANIETIPSSLFVLCTSLTSLNLSKNHIKEIPETISRLTSLQTLRLDANALNNLPTEIGELESLKKFRIENNPLNELAKDVVWEMMRKGSKVVLSYLRQRRMESSWSQMKLMFLGQEGVGKTSLIRCFVRQSKDEANQLSGDTVSTDGIQIGSWKVDQALTFSIWDFGGQAVFYPTHQFFLTNRSVYLLVFKMSDPNSVKRISYWLKKVKTITTEKVAVLIVGTHLDACEPSVVESTMNSLKKSFPSIYNPEVKGFYAVSCKSKKGLSTLKKALKQAARDQPVLNQAVPKCYGELAVALEREKQKRSYVSLAEFEDMAGAVAIPYWEIPIVLQFFTDTGLVVYFNDTHADLNKLVILKPQWLANLMATVITFSHSFVKNGILQHSDLKHIWVDYPADMHPTLLGLLSKFEVAYPFSKDPNDKRSIVPSLLPPQRPVDQLSQVWKPRPTAEQTQYGRVYQFQFVPLGFFGRLILRVYHTPETDVLGECAWLSGFVCKMSDQTALLLLNEETYRLEIRVRAPSSSVDKSKSLLRVLLDIVESLLEFHYPRITGTTRRFIPCSHCIDKNLQTPFLFPFEDCVHAVHRAGSPFVYCNGIPSRAVRVDLMAPDLVFQEIPIIEHLSIATKIGEGGFGIVYKGELAVNKLGEIVQKGTPDSRLVPVAVKELREDADALDNKVNLEKFNEFQRETYIMSCIDHPNLVHLHGIQLRPNLRMIMEYIPDGDLYHWMRSGVKVTWEERLKIAYDIACGMRHLHGLTPPITHCDLRSPNVFLSLNASSSSSSKKKSESSGRVKIVAKVADFGLSRKVFSKIAGFMTSWQWMPPEAIDVDNQSFTEKIDVYSFAIVLWEIAASGAFPFEEFEEFRQKRGDTFFWNEGAMKQAVLSGLRPTIPADTPEEYATLMKLCWSHFHEDRPSFEGIVELLRTILLAHSMEYALEEAHSVALTVRAGTVPVHFDDDESTFQATVRHVRQLHNDSSAAPLTLLFVPLTSSLWAGCSDGFMSVYNTTTWNRVGHFQAHGSRVYDMVLVESSSGSLEPWSCSEDGTVTVHSSQFLQANSTFVAHGGSMVRCLCGVVAPESDCAYSVWTVSPEALALCVWNADDGVRQTQVKLSMAVTAMRQSNKHVWLGGATEVLIFEAESCQQVLTVQAHTGIINQVLPTTVNTVWTAANDNTLKVWNAAGARLLDTLTGVDSRVLSLAQVGDNMMWAGGFDKNMLVFDLKTRRPIEEVLTIHKDAVRTLVWIQGRSATGVHTVCSGSRDGSIVVWEQLVRDESLADRNRHSSDDDDDDDDDASSASGKKQISGRGAR